MAANRARNGRKKTLVSLAVLAALAVGAGAAQGATTDEKKLKEVREMFSSKYQEEDYYRTDRLLLSSTGTFKPIYRAPAVADVLTAEDMEEAGVRTLYEALELVNGVHVGLSPQNAMSPIISLRGIHTSLNPQVLLMMNGIPISSLFTGTRAFLHMPLAGIARIEVVRGPGSAVYGADAFAGTVNIITKDGKDLEGSVAGVGAGSFDTYQAWAQTGSTLGPYEYFLNVGYLKTKGDKDRVIDSDLGSVLGASLAPGALDTSQEVLNANFSVARGNWTFKGWGITQEGGVGDGVTNNLSSTGQVEVDQYLLDLAYRNTKLVSDLDCNLRLYHMYWEQDAFLQVFPAGTTLPIGADGNIDFTSLNSVFFTDGVFGEPVQKDHQTGIDLTLLYEGLRSHRFRLATGYKDIREDYEEYKNFGPGTPLDGGAPPAVQDGTLTDVSGTPFCYMEKQHRRLWYVSIQDEWSFAKKWELTAGVRYDSYSDFGDTVNPRAALVWDTRPDLTTKLLYGKAFRAPSSNELYVRNNPSNLGNPSLEPETIQTGEFVLDYQPTKQLRLVCNTFYYEIKDLIELVQDPGTTTKTSQNNKNQKGYGFEMEADWEITPKIRLKAAYAYQRAKDKDSDELVAEAPQQKILINPHWQFLPGWSLDTQLYMIADRPRASGDTRPAIKDYQLVNLVVRKRDIIHNWDLALAVKNVFNEDAREPSGYNPDVPQKSNIPNDYPMEGRSIYGELQVRF
ncbi:MAG: TonB-dependent receptor [Desulfobulbaceae bacterium]|nr:TonB-dependent receptor [Desulfobulbaceae bacterium]